MARLTDLFPPLPDLWGAFDQMMGRGLQPASPSYHAEPGYPALNVFEQGERVVLEAELPGVAAPDIDISVAGQEVTIKGERKPPQLAKPTWTRQECPYGKFGRTVTLPWEVDADTVEASLHEGVLTVALSRSEKCRTRKIAVKTT
jgi:HSP20 family protein